MTKALAILLCPRGRLAILVFLLVKGCLIILTAIEYSEKGYLVGIRVERDYNAFAVARSTQTGSDIVHGTCLVVVRPKQTMCNRASC